MTTYEKRFYELGQFLGGFFHQDWKEVLDWQDEKPNFEAVVSFYKTLASPTELAMTTEQLRQFLALPLSEGEFSDIATHDLGTVYTPRSRGMTKRQFLEEVWRILEEPTARPSTLRFVG